MKSKKCGTYTQPTSVKQILQIGAPDAGWMFAACRYGLVMLDPSKNFLVRSPRSLTSWVASWSFWDDENLMVRGFLRYQIHKLQHDHKQVGL